MQVFEGARARMAGAVRLRRLRCQWWRPERHRSGRPAAQPGRPGAGRHRGGQDGTHGDTGRTYAGRPGGAEFGKRLVRVWAGQEARAWWAAC